MSNRGCFIGADAGHEYVKLSCVTLIIYFMAIDGLLQRNTPLILCRICSWSLCRCLEVNHISVNMFHYKPSCVQVELVRMLNAKDIQLTYVTSMLIQKHADQHIKMSATNCP